MERKKTYSYQYDNITLKTKVGIRFRRFSKKIARNHSDTINTILDFFEWHNYSPHQRFAKDINASVELNRKRIEAHIAISKSIEKAHNIPLTTIETMLKSLFQEELKMDEIPLKDLEVIQPNDSKSKKEKTTVSKIKHDRTQRKLNEVKERLHYVLNQIEPVSNRFGKDFLKIEITREEWARFKQLAKEQ
ncbi:BfmA/BtgA family mobilization protein [uncultured Croceitalea sp.]|uniref:BfmA/BtgA family mobilization protein n=1 Tax=uncultured Croceitalea sp. TaxID=1798908 RepID=UPI00330650AA